MLTQAINEARGDVSRAAQAMKACIDTVRDKPLDAMSGDVKEKFERAKADHAASAEKLSQLNARAREIEDTDRAYAETSAPVAGVTTYGQAELAEGHVTATAPVERARPRGRSYHAGVSGPIKAEEHRKAYGTFIRRGPVAFQLENQHIPSGPRNALMTSSGELGGFLVPHDFRTELLSDVAAASIMMRLARRIPTSTNEATFPTIQSDTTSPRIYRSGFRGQFRAEGELGNPGTSLTAQNQPKFGQKNIPVHSWMPDPVLLTPEMLEDSAINVEQILNDVIAEQLALEMDSMCLVNGTGSGEPRGIIADTNVAIITATAAASIDYNAWIDLIFGPTGLPAQYRPGATIVMNTATYAATLKLNDGADRPLINVFTAPDSIYSYPIEFSEFLAVPASSAKVAIFGNFNNYGIAERTDLRIQRLDQAYPPNIAFLARARYGGDTLRSAAFKILKCAA